MKLNDFKFGQIVRDSDNIRSVVVDIQPDNGRDGSVVCFREGDLIPIVYSPGSLLIECQPQPRPIYRVTTRTVPTTSRPVKALLYCGHDYDKAQQEFYTSELFDTTAFPTKETTIEQLSPMVPQRGPQ